MVETSDKTLIEKTLKGDKKSFEILVEKYYRPIYNLAYRMTGNKEDSEDITQMVFTNAYNKLENYQPAYRFFSWIYKIAVNESLNSIKKQQKYSDLQENFPSLSKPIEVENEKLFISFQVHKAIMELAPKYRILIILKHIQKCQYSDISKIIGITENKVKSRLYTGRQLLREILIKRKILKNVER
jgi:RNA polymerase sigma-70 factor (ECF subfamily)